MCIRDRVSLIGVLLVCQVLLGASIIWSGRAVWIATGHVVVGAAILALTVVVILRTWKLSYRTKTLTVQSPIAEGSAA